MRPDQVVITGAVLIGGAVVVGIFIVGIGRILGRWAVQTIAGVRSLNAIRKARHGS